MAGYSGTPLAKKLGIKTGFRIALINAPEGFLSELNGLPDDVKMDSRAAKESDLILYFVKSAGELKKRFPDLAARLAQSGMLWISWPKKSSGVVTDLTENVVREIGLEVGLVDVKVCAVNEIWSGLKFVIRLKDRVSV
jgi:hypothetical protein